jgi:hypothetical protein
MSIKKPGKRRARNPVAKFARICNRDQTHTDRKKAAKQGYVRCRQNLITQGDSKAA